LLPHEVHQLMQLRWDITPCAGELSDPRWTKTPKDLLREERRGEERPRDYRKDCVDESCSHVWRGHGTPCMCGTDGWTAHSLWNKHTIHVRGLPCFRLAREHTASPAHMHSGPHDFWCRSFLTDRHQKYLFFVSIV
jgi:hypothetical protein